MEELKICEICCEEYDNNERKKIKCPKCGLELCLSCGKRILLSQTIEYRCPNQKCKENWDFTFIYNTFPVVPLSNVTSKFV